MVIVYVVVAGGVTWILPCRGTMPMLGVITTCVAPKEHHRSSANDRWRPIVSGDAMSDPVTGVDLKSAGGFVTLIVTAPRATTPSTLVATTSYVVGPRGETPMLPFGPTIPMF